MGVGAGTELIIEQEISKGSDKSDANDSGWLLGFPCNTEEDDFVDVP